MKAVINATKQTSQQSIRSFPNTGFYMKISAFAETKAGEIFPIVDASFYQPKSTVTCVLRTQGGICAVAKAGGGGYHKPSAALEDACLRAGITLSECISGDQEMKDAIAAIARTQTGKRSIKVYVAHGY